MTPLPVVAPKKVRYEPTEQEVMDALLLHQFITITAASLDRSIEWLKIRIRQWDLHPVTGRPRIADPVEQQEDVDRAVVERAILLGIWHIDRNGELQQYDKADPYRGRCPNLLDRKQL